MLRYKGFISIGVKIAVLGGLYFGANYIHTEYELSLPLQFEKVQAYRENKVISANNEISIARYRDNAGKLSQIHDEIKKTTSITKENRDNFLGFMGQTINSYHLNINKITYVNMNDYVDKNIAKKPDAKPNEKIKVYDSVIRDKILTDTVGMKALVDESSGSSTFRVKEKDKPSIDSSKLDGILVDVSGDTNLYNFMLDLEKYNFKYLVAGLETDKEKSTVKLIIDLR